MKAYGKRRLTVAQRETVHKAVISEFERYKQKQEVKDMIKAVRKSWRRFYRKHKTGLSMLEDFIGALSIFVSIYCMYILLWLLGGK